MDTVFGCKSQTCLVGVYSILPVYDGTGSLLEYGVQFLRACFIKKCFKKKKKKGFRELRDQLQLENLVYC